ncbi:hypothetical protein AB7M16_000424 [Bradyrhizobium sp. USDA 372]
MVYDRERKGPALIGTDMAANLTKERAEQLLRLLMPSRVERPPATNDSGPPA